MMKMLYGRSTRDQGSIDVFGYDPATQELAIKYLAGLVPQDNNLDDELNVFDNLKIYSQFYGLSKDLAKSRIDQLLDFMDLAEKKHAHIKTLSGGMQRRLLIARALLNNLPQYPSLYKRLFSIWYRHFRVYLINIFSNGMPPFLEPLLFLAGVGLGLRPYINQSIDGLPYIVFLGTALPMTSAMFTTSFECTFGTFIRMEFEKVYDGMLAAPITAENLVVGEMIWAGTKGLFFSSAVAFMLAIFGVINLKHCLLLPVLGFMTGVMFSTVGMLVTSFVKTINNFNFYFSGFISPMFFFSGVVFPISNLPSYLQPLAEIAPLTHAVRLSRAICTNEYHLSLLYDLLYIILFSLIIGYFAIKRLKRRLIH